MEAARIMIISQDHTTNSNNSCKANFGVMCACWPLNAFKSEGLNLRGQEGMSPIFIIRINYNVSLTNLYTFISIMTIYFSPVTIIKTC